MVIVRLKRSVKVCSVFYIDCTLGSHKFCSSRDGKEVKELGGGGLEVDKEARVKAAHLQTASALWRRPGRH